MRPRPDLALEVDIDTSRFALGLTCLFFLLAFSSSAYAAELRLDAAAFESYDIRSEGDEILRVSIEVRDPLLLEIANPTRDLILEIAGRELRLRSASWRGPEQGFRALIESTGNLSLEIAPDDPISPSGSFELTLSPAPADANALAAERAMTEAADLNLQYYSGQGDTRTRASELYEAAAESFALALQPSREADALYEAATVDMALCRRSGALEKLIRADRLWTELGDRNGAAAARNLRGLLHWEIGEARAATSLFEAAGQLRTDSGRTYFLAETINNRGLVELESGDVLLGKQLFEEALTLWQSDANLLDDPIDSQAWLSLKRPPWLQASLKSLVNIGLANEMFGDVYEAERVWERAMQLSQFMSSGFTRAVIETNLGKLRQSLGRIDDALALLKSAENYFLEVSPEDSWAGRVQYNLGLLYRDIDDQTAAMDAFRSSLEFRDDQCDPVGRAQTLREIAELELLAGNRASARKMISEGLALLSLFDGNESARASLVDLSGRVSAAEGSFDQADLLHGSALRLYVDRGDLQGHLRTLINRADSRTQGGKLDLAVQDYRKSIELAIKVQSPIDEFQARVGLGRVRLQQGDSAKASFLAKEALRVAQSARNWIVRPRFARQFSAVERAAYDVIVAAELALGNVEQAWKYSDESKAQFFRSTLLGSNSVDQENAVFRGLAENIGLQVEKRSALLARGQIQAAKVLSRKIEPLIDELDEIVLGTRAADLHHQYGLDDLVAMLRPGDVVLSYHLGEATSAVWRIDSHGITHRSLPSAHVVARKVEAVLGRIRSRRTAVSVLADLSRSIVPEQLLRESDTNLIIVSDGVLHQLPFSALRASETEGVLPMVQGRTLTVLPSAGMVGAFRESGRPTYESLAIIADPVFGADDPRVMQSDSDSTPSALGSEPLLERGMSTLGYASMPRLPGTGSEARAILKIAGDRSVMLLEGFDATRAQIVSGRLRNFDILHLATHGIADLEHPAFSGLVFAGIDASGTDIPRFVRSQEIAGLQLGAQLVVLSACETGVGQSIRGEGILGLSRSFFYAGAQQVLSTLWKVPDRATAELMKRFYHALLQQNMSAAEALRSAQNQLRSNPRWRKEFYWGAFVLQGDWR